MAIRIGIYGYGNLGRGVELAIRQNPDMVAVGVFTRRNPESVKTLTGIPVYAADDAKSMQGEIDVMILCGGSSTDLYLSFIFFLQRFYKIFKRIKVSWVCIDIEQVAVAVY